MNSDDNLIRDLVFTAMDVPGVEGLCMIEALTNALPSSTGVTFISGIVQAPDYGIVLAQMQLQVLDRLEMELEGGS